MFGNMFGMMSMFSGQQMVLTIFVPCKAAALTATDAWTPKKAVFRMDQEVSARLAEVQLCQGTLPGWGQLNPQFHWV